LEGCSLVALSPAFVKVDVGAPGFHRATPCS
jgi:hypothetical protein